VDSVTAPVHLVSVPDHALRQFKELVLMPATHGRVAQRSYLRREPPHVAGQLLQVIHRVKPLSQRGPLAQGRAGG
jgi:hypothetical protein